MKLLITVLDSAHYPQPILNEMDIDDSGLDKQGLLNILSACLAHAAKSITEHTYPDAEPQDDNTPDA